MAHAIALTIRCALMIAFVAFGAAVVVGRQARESGRRQSERTNLTGLGILEPSRTSTGFRLLEAGSGVLQVYPLPESDQLDLASVAPWTDELGRRQVVGRWAKRTSRLSSALPEQFGLIRYDVSSNEVIDRATLDVVPTSPPCWYPGATARILFVGADGRIHRYEFEDAAGQEIPDCDRGARTLQWLCRLPSGFEPVVTDICWPTAPGFETTLIASLSTRSSKDHHEFLPIELWAITLDVLCESIVGARPLVIDAPASDQQFQRRRPSVGRTTDGRLLLAYLERRLDGPPVTELKVCGISAIGDSSGLLVGRSRVIEEDCAPLLPAFSEDGESITYLKHGRQSGLEMGRAQIDLDAAFDP
jgi:hypothetical protein